MANVKPVANIVSVSGIEDTSPISITLTGSDADGGVASFKIKQLPSKGSLFLDAAMTIAVLDDGIYAASGNALNLWFRPKQEFFGTSAFEYQAIDNLGALSSGAKATINVAAVNDAPMPIDVLANGSEDATVEIKLKATDIDSKVVSFTVVDLPVDGTLCLNKDGSGVIAAGAVISVGTKLYFKADPDWNGATDFHYRATDDLDDTSTIVATATINLASVNDRPVSDNVAAAGNHLATSIPITLSGDDVDGTVVAFKLESLPKIGALYVDAGLTILAKSGQTLTATDETLTLYLKPDATLNGQTAFKYSAIDDLGQRSETPGIATITIDSIAPTTTISGIDISSDTGTSAADFLTQAAAQTITGTLSAGLAAGEILYGSVDGGATWTDISGMVSGTAISWTGATLSGSSAIAFKVTDTAGNDGSVASQSYELDTTAPATTISGIDISSDTGSSAADFLTDTAAQTITGTLSAGLASGDILHGSVDGGATWTDISGTVSGTAIIWTGATLAGSSAIAFKVTDAAGNDGSVASQPYVLDTAAPSAPVITSFADDTGTPDSQTSDRTLTLFGTAEANATVEVFDGGASLGTATANGSGAWTFDTATLSLSTHNFTATATDAAGNTGMASTVLSVTVSASTVLDLTFLPGTHGFVIQGDAAGDWTGRGVGSAGDVNGDGVADLIVGAGGGDDGGLNAGEAYVVFGKASGFGTVDGTGRSVIDLSNLTPGDGFVVQGDAGMDYAGLNVASAGDVNGDGLADIIVGGDSGDDGGFNAGEAYVVFGKASGFGAVDGTGRAVIDLTNLSVADGFIIRGDTSLDYAGFGVSSAGDVNGDGFADLVLGADRGDDGGFNAGEAYVVFGKVSGFGAVDGTGRAIIDLSNVGGSFTADQGFIIQGDSAGDWAGRSVSSAGDVNGDGFADLIVGAPFGSDGGALAGEAYVVFGKASGFGAVDGTGRAVIDLSNIASIFTSTTGFVIQGDVGSNYAGWSVSSAGDVNGDGFDDLLVGAKVGDIGGVDSGEAYVVFGKASGFGTVDGTGRSVVDLSNLSPADGFWIQGDTTGDNAGQSVAAAGDINGDGFADVIIGARLGDDGGHDAGEAYVLFGKASGFGSSVGGHQVVDLTNFSAADGFIIQGDSAFDQAGYSVSAAGDVNGDGFSDLIVGAPFGDDGGTDAGEAYVLFGGAFGGPSTAVNTTGTSAAEIFIGGLGNDSLTGGGGVDVFRSGAGDDTIGIGDLSFRSIDGGSGADTLALSGSGLSLDLTNRTLSAKISGIERIDLTGGGNNTLAVDKLAVLNEVGADSTGTHVLTVDGNAGAAVTFAETQWTNVGTVTEGGIIYDRYVFDNAEARVAQGVSVTFPGVFDLTSLKPTQGFIIQGDTANDAAGLSVHSAGDVNGDGFADLIVGAYIGDDGGSNAGEAYVVFGKAGGFGANVGGRQVIDLTSLSAADGFIIQGDAAGDFAGVSVSSADDVNGDGFADLIIGASRGYDGGTWAGEAYVVFGGASGFGSADGAGRQVIDLTTLAASDGFVIQGDTALDHAGTRVSSAGDVNGDGFADLIVGAPFGDDGGSDAGEAYVLLGKAAGFGTNVGGRQVIDLTSLSAAEGFIIQGDAASDWAGFSASTAGDVNGDGFADLIVGAPFGDDGGNLAGEAYVVFGKASSFGTSVGGRQVIDLSNIASSFTSATGFIIQGDVGDNYAGWSVSSAGDVNGDGFDDLLVGAKVGDIGGVDSGEAYVVFGKASGFGTVDGTGRSVVDLSNLSPADGFWIQGDTTGDNAGQSVAAAGDINGDGFADVIIGARLGDDGGHDAGEAYVLFGKVSGFGSSVGGHQVVDLTNFSAADGFIIQGDSAFDQAGYSVSAAGDVNGDGFSDLIVGARDGDDGGTNAGEAYVLFGGAFGASANPVVTTGSAAAEIFIGGIGNDILTGNGGADVFHAGSGDDTIVVPHIVVAGVGFRLADGGLGTDTLKFTGDGQTFDFSTLSSMKVRGIEAIDFTGTGNNTLTLRAGDVLQFSDTPNADFAAASGHNSLVVLGDLGDTLNLIGFDPDGAGGNPPVSSWALQSSDVNLDGSASGIYDLYDLMQGTIHIASVAVHHDVTVDATQHAAFLV